MAAAAVPVYSIPRICRFLQENEPRSQLFELKNIELGLLQEQSTVMLDRVGITPFLVPHRDEYSETVGFRI